MGNYWQGIFWNCRVPMILQLVPHMRLTFNNYGFWIKFVEFEPKERPLLAILRKNYLICDCVTQPQFCKIWPLLAF